MMAEAKRYPLLDSLQSPADIRQLTVTELEKLAAEIRCLLVDTVSQTGGHLAPSLGTVELTLALYSVYHFPEDKLVWDVGHQAYTHKILSGRRDSFHTLRQLGGITGFPKRSESEYDAFGVGHASTAISAALGMAVARDLQGRHNRVVAVLGDGALTGGLAYEGLNNAGMLHSDITVILNDNGRSIDANVGALSEYLSAIRIAPQYARAKQDVHELLSGTHFGRRVLKTAAAIKDSVRAALVPGDIFEEMGFHYVGPLDGHNIGQLQEVLRQVQQLHGPVLVHIHTQKGKGYAPAEAAADKYHGVQRFNVVTGEQVSLVEPTRELQGYAVAGNTAVTVEQGTARRRALSRGAAPSETATPMVYIKNRQLMLSQGNDIKTLSPNGLQESYIWPSLSPAGDKVLYYVCGVGAFVCDLSGNIVARLGALRAPQWYGNSVVVGMNDSDDGHTVVASSIVATTLTGESQTLTPDSLIAMFPQTCERAGRIAFTTAEGELYMIQLEK